MSFVGEIKRRRVVHVAVVYIVVAWLMAQVVDVLNEPLNLPGWFDTTIIVALAVGFPIAVVLAWAFDITPDGVVRTSREAPAGDSESAEAAVLETPSIAPVRPREGPLPNSVAVLPFENLSPNPDDAYFSAGVHEEIITHLAKIKDLNVIARTSAVAGGSPLPRRVLSRSLVPGTASSRQR